MAPAARRAPTVIRTSTVLLGAVGRWTRQPCSHAALHIWIDRLYVLVLPAVAKWDAARFLTLSVNPGARRPPEDGTIDGEMCDGDAICEAPPAGDEDSGHFRTSEGLHAFLPLFPPRHSVCGNRLDKSRKFELPPADV